MKEEQTLKLIGHIRGYETDLDNNIIPGTEFEGHNTILSALKYYLANCISANVDESLDSLFATEAIATELAAHNAGIAHVNISTGVVDLPFITVLNTGGTGAESYVEFYGYITGAATLWSSLVLGFYLQGTAGTENFSKAFASYTINKTVAANRRYHFYWKITIG